MKKIYIKILLMVIFIGCAKILPPPGGDRDNLSPKVEATLPTNGSVNVNNKTKIIFKFNKKIDFYKTNKYVDINPQVPYIKVWHDSILTIIPQEKWSNNTSYKISLKRIYDYHSLVSQKGYVYFFSTYDKLDTFNIVVNIELKGKQRGNNIKYIFENYYDNKFDNITEGFLNIKSKLSFNWLSNGNYRLVFIKKDTILCKSYSIKNKSIFDTLKLKVGVDTIKITNISIPDSKWIFAESKYKIKSITVNDTIDGKNIVSKWWQENKKIYISTQPRKKNYKYILRFMSFDTLIFIRAYNFVESGVIDTLPPFIKEILPPSKSLISNNDTIKIIFSENIFIDKNDNTIFFENLLTNSVIPIENWKIKEYNVLRIEVKNENVKSGRFLLKVKCKIEDWNANSSDIEVENEYLIVEE